MAIAKIVHATSLAVEDRAAFEHAVALAAATNARLVSLHARDGGPCAEIPDAASVVASWGGEPIAVAHEVQNHGPHDDPLDSLLAGLRELAPDLIVIGTHQRGGVARLLESSHAEAVVANVPVPTLVFPIGATPFVADDGSVALRRVVVPSGDPAATRAALARLVWLCEALDLAELEVVMLLAEGMELDGDFPFRHRSGWTIQVTTSQQDVASAVVEASSDACLVLMSTRQVDSLRDAVFGTHTEAVMRTSRAPVLVAPMS